MPWSSPYRAVCFAVAALLLAPPLVAESPAGCTLNEEASEVRRSISREVRCNDKRFRNGPTEECTLFAPPVCAGSLVADAVALAYGPNNPPAAAIDTRTLRDQLTCQKRIGSGVSGYVHKKLRGLIRGEDLVKLEAKARRQLDRMPDKCLVNVAQDVSQVLVPAVGPQCGAAVGDAGSPVDAPALRDCLVTLLQVWVDRWGPNPQPLRPNILFILTDDQRWDTTDATHSVNGGDDVMPRTRAELAADGVEFPEAFMTTPLCCPSRSSILTGEYSHRTGVYKNGGNNGGADDFDDSAALPIWLQSAGYRTSLIGKYLNGYAQLWDSGAGDPPYVPPGWTEWRGMKNVAFYNYRIVEPDGLGGYVENFYGDTEADYSTDVLREKAKTFISDSVSAGEPFFLYLAFKAPHLPQIPAMRHIGLFANVPDWRPPSYNEADVSDKPTWMQTLPLQDSNDLDQVRIDQLEMLQAVDEAIGGKQALDNITGIMEHLRNEGVADNTIVVFFSDNGWLWGEHRLRAKNQPYEESIRAPMMVRYPKLVPLPRVESRFALNIDLAPTFAELAGAGVPLFQDGASLVRVLDGTQDSWRTDILTEAWPGSHPWATVREAQWKYTEIALDPGNPSTTFDRELYDLLGDPYEQINVVGANPGIAATMAARLRQLRQFWPVDSDPNGPDPEEDE